MKFSSEPGLGTIKIGTNSDKSPYGRSVTNLILCLKKAIKSQLLLGITLCLLCSCSDDESIPEEDLRTVMLKEINILRAQGCICGNDFMPPVPEVGWNDTLSWAAQGNAIDMYVNNFFSHISPTMGSPISRAMAEGYGGGYVGETIARNYKTVKSVMLAWRESESHCRAIMDSIYFEIGAAKYNNYWVLKLGRPKNR